MNTKACFALLFGLTVFLAQGQTKKMDRSISNHLDGEKDPTISPDGRYMYFARNTGEDSEGHKTWEIVYSEKRGSQWTQPEELIAINKSASKITNNADPCVSFDNKSLFFTSDRYGGLGFNDIWFIEKHGEQWIKPQNVGKPINTVKYHETSPSLSADGEYLYFARETADGCGEIYMAKKKNSFLYWEEPVKLPAPINTGCETAPRILPDNETLIFASKRAGGKGGYDLYLSRKEGDNKWSDPVPLDFMNTPEDEGRVTVDATGKIIYNSKKGENSLDLFMTILPEDKQPKNVVMLQGTVTDNTSGAILKGYVRAYDVNSGDLARKYKVDPYDGTYTMLLTEGSAYDVAITPPDAQHSFHSEFFAIPELEESELHRIDAKLVTLNTKANFALNNIFYEPLSADMSDHSTYEVYRLVQTLESNPNMKIEIGVHMEGYKEDSVKSSSELTEVIIDTIPYQIIDTIWTDSVTTTVDTAGNEIEEIIKVSEVSITDTFKLKYTYHNDRTEKQANALRKLVIEKSKGAIKKEAIKPKGYGEEPYQAHGETTINLDPEGRVVITILKK